MISRDGVVEYVIIGDDKEILIPELTKYPLGKKALRGLRCVHTHLKNEPLSKDDLTDLSLLRLDAMAAIGVGDDGLPDKLYFSNLLPLNLSPEDDALPYKVHTPILFHQLRMEFLSFIEGIEEEMRRTTTVKVKGALEQAVLVSVSTTLSTSKQQELLGELKNLAYSSKIEVIDTICQRPKKLNPKYLLGPGKIKELIITALSKQASLLIFNQELTPTQTRELGKITELKVIDRTQLILDIFASRAHSRDGKVQVELAQLKYLLPKLSGKGTEMSRLMGGIGGRGPGETKLEIDRRRVTDRISRLEKELKTLEKGRIERRKKRGRTNLPIISIVGYTNAGKSTLLNALTNSTTLAEDKLFATLDTATRRLRFPKERDAVITDTVGFISDMPRELMKAFKATLEEMQDANLLIHVVDITDTQMDENIRTVENVLNDLGLISIPTLMVMNKVDMIDKIEAMNICERLNALGVSALKAETLKPLVKKLEANLFPEKLKTGDG